jgi:hypothetical protein
MISRIRLVDGAIRTRVDAIAEKAPKKYVSDDSLPTRRGIDEGHLKRARELLKRLVSWGKSGEAVVCTYKAAFEHIFSKNWRGQGHSQQVTRVAEATQLVELHGLGLVRLDAFIVTGKTRSPGLGHWKRAEYDREQWERALGTADLITNERQLGDRLQGSNRINK